MCVYEFFFFIYNCFFFQHIHPPSESCCSFCSGGWVCKSTARWKLLKTNISKNVKHAKNINMHFYKIRCSRLKKNETYILFICWYISVFVCIVTYTANHHAFYKGKKNKENKNFNTESSKNLYDNKISTQVTLVKTKRILKNFGFLKEFLILN